MLENVSFSNAFLTSGCMAQSRPRSFFFCLNNRSGQERPTFKKKKYNCYLTKRQTDD